jgi:hypothetical protein
MLFIDLFKSRRRLEAENLFLRHQLSVALRRAPSRLRLSGWDRALLVWMIRLWPSLLGVTKVVEPETILRWLSFPKMQSGGIRAVRQNQRIIRCDVCDHPPACNVYSRSVQVTTPA